MLDLLYARWLASRLFADGWGHEPFLDAVRADPGWAARDAELSVSWSSCSPWRGVECLDGRFPSPGTQLAGNPAQGLVRWLRSPAAPSARRGRLTLVAGGSGEHGFAMRQAIWAPLVSDHTDLLLLETPWHGQRRPARTRGLPTVSDQLAMNRATAHELQGLLRWARTAGYTDLTLAGYSMGGFMAAVAACHWPAPLRVLLMAVGRTPVPAYLGPMTGRKTDFRALGAALKRDAPHAAARLSSLLSGADLDRQPPPRWLGGISLVAARRDRYIPLAGAEALHRHWPGSTLSVIDTDHIGLVVFHRQRLRRALVELLQRELPADASGPAGGSPPR